MGKGREKGTLTSEPIGTLRPVGRLWAQLEPPGPCLAEPWDLLKGTPAFSKRLMFTLTAGSVAAFIANPIDVVLVRMQSDGHWPRSQQRNYNGILDGLFKVATQEGVLALWRGCGPTMTRAALVTSCQVVTYEDTA